MTDQPDRQDGDGLLFGLEERLDRLCLTAKDGSQFILSTKSARNIVGIVREWIRVKVPPTRDGVEGAGTSPIGQSDVEMLRHLADSTGFGRTHDMLRRVIAATPYLSTPPKPAPDAMRDTIRKAMNHLSRSGFTLRDNEAFEYLTNAVATTVALSAPVPPADGATQAMNEALARHYNIPDELWKGATKDNPKVPPSPVVAAEPVAWQPILNFAQAIPSNVDDATGVAYVPFAKAMGVAASLTAGQFRRLLATPPVKGNREAIMALIEKHVGATMDLMEGEGVLLGIGEAADSILSLSIQHAIDKTKLYTAINKFIPQDMIDSIWQEVQEAIL